jgi:N-acetylneuraminic acid mutarotase/uncharacterized coiled-coil protein SlyX
LALLLSVSMLLSLAAVTGAEPAEARVNLPPIAVPASWASGVIIGDNAYVIGGSQDYIVDVPPTLSSVQIYSIATGETSIGAAMPKGVTGAAYGVGVDGRIYIAGGWNASDGSYYQKVQIYDPVGDSWTLATGSIPEPIGRSASAMSADGTLYVFGGGWTSNVTLKYNTSSNVWKYGAQQPVFGLDGRAVAYNDTAVIVFGGSYGGSSSGVRIYNPVANTWSLGTPSPITEAYAAPVLASNGYIYLFGGTAGSAGDPNPVPTVMRYSPSDDVWEVSNAVLSSGRDSMVAVFMQMPGYGKAVVLGGFDGSVAVSTVDSFVISEIAGVDLIEISSPQDGSIVSGVVPVHVEKVNGMTDFVQIDLFVDGVLHETRTAAMSVTFLWDTSGLADGSSHTLMARGYNLDGTVSETSVVVTVSAQSIDQKMSALELQVSLLQTKLNSLNSSVEAMQSDIDALQAQLNILKANQTTQSTKLDQLQTQLDNMQSQLNKVKTSSDNGSMFGIVGIVLMIVVLALVAMMFMASRKKP